MGIGDESKAEAESLAQYELLKKKRSDLRRKYTTALRSLTDLCAAEPKNVPEIVGQMAVFETRALALFAVDEELSPLLQKYLSEDDFEKEDTEMDRRNIDYVKLKSTVEYITKTEGIQKNGNNTQNSVPSSCGTMEEGKLARIPIREFDGDFMQYRGWRAHFDSLVHNKPYSTTAKASYLEKALVKKGRDVLDEIGTEPENYDEVLRKLDERFGNPAILLCLFVNKIYQAESVNDETAVDSLRKLVNVFASSLREIRGIISKVIGGAVLTVNTPDGKTVDFISILLCPMLMGKIPAKITLRWSRTAKSVPERFDVSKLLDYLEEELQAREGLLAVRNEDINQNTVSSISKPMPVHHSESRERGQVKERSKSNVFVGASAAPTCPFGCQKGHPLYQCPTFKNMDVNSRSHKVDEWRRCRNCLNSNHLAPQCVLKLRCQICGEAHNSLLHKETPRSNNRRNDDRRREDNRSNKDDAPTSTLNPNAATYFSDSRRGSGYWINPRQGALLMTCLVKINGRVVRALLDSACSENYIRRSIVDELGIPEVGRTSLTCNVFVKGSFTTDCGIHVVNLESIFPEYSGLKDVSCLSVPELIPPEPGVEINPTDIPHLKDLLIAEDYDGHPRKVDMIIGCRDYFRSLKFQFRVPDPGSRLPTATETVFGWVLGGDVPQETALATRSVFFAGSTQVEPIFTDQVERMWEIDSAGINERTYEIPDLFEKKVEYRDGRYHVPLLWKGEQRPEDNEFQVMKFQERHTKSLNRDSHRLLFYEEYMKEMEKEKFVEEVPKNSNYSYYLPHHDVWKRDKLRVVYNGQFPDKNGISINQLLDKGPNLNGKVVDILLRFRVGGYFVAQGDVRKAFLMLGLQEEDQRYVQFLWDGKIFIFKRIPFGLSCSPALLSLTLNHHLDSHVVNSNTATILKDSLFVDDVIRSFPEKEERDEFIKEAKEIFLQAGMDLREKQEDSVLGLEYLPEEDILFVPLITSAQDKTITRRVLLGEISKIYDPLGLVTPFVIRGRLLFQRTWSLQLGWDDPLPVEYQEMWNILVQEALGHRESFPRHIKTSNDIMQIHVFSDASLFAYGAVIYLYSPPRKPEILFVKGKLAPLKHPLTIPRLELMGAWIASKITTYVLNSCPNLVGSEIVFWCDNSAVLTWIKKGPGFWKLFVNNRVRDILAFPYPHEWRYVPTALNPADVITRGLTVGALSGEFWRHGPDFIVDRNSWPESRFVPEYSEMKKDCDTSAFVVTARMNPEDIASRYEKLDDMVRVFSFVRRFWDKKYRGIPMVTAEEKIDTFKVLLRREQDQFITPEIICRYKLRISMKEDLMCATTRTGETLPILPPTYFGSLVVNNRHSKLFHQGVSSTLAQVSSEFLLLRGRSFVKETINNCRVCRRFQAPRCKPTESGLPESRITETRPFETCGVDYFGPLTTTDKESTYVLICTCAVTRGVHLELIPDQSAEQTGMALRRLIARRGNVKVIYLDNAKSFRKLSQLHDEIIWRFIPERAPWWGGFYERLVGVTKASLRKVIRNQRFSFIELQTIMCELEERINRRPLICPEDSPPLTPAHFIYGAMPPILAPHDVQFEEVQLTRRWYHRQRIADNLWSRWRKEYLPTLRSWRKGIRTSIEIKPGDVVLVDDGNLPRMKWPLARVVSLIEGNDGVVRAAVICFSDPRRKNKQLVPIQTRRPLQRLVLLEAFKENEVPTPIASELRPENPPSVIHRKRKKPDVEPKDPVLTRREDLNENLLTRVGRKVVLPPRFRD